MSQENVEIVRKTFDALNAFFRGQIKEAPLDLVDPELEFRWHAGRLMPDAPQDLHGISAFIGFVEQMRSAWADLVLEPLEFTEVSEERVLTLIEQTGQGRESGVPIAAHLFELITIRDGKMRNVEVFRHRAHALEAAGLSG